MRKTGWTCFCCCLALLGCGGHYEVGSERGAAQEMPGADRGGQGVGSGSSMGVAGSSTAAGSAAGGGAALIVEIDTALASGCGLPAEPPAAFDAPITNYMMWWFRLQHLIWGEQHDPPESLPFELSYEEAGKFVDLAIDRAIAETGGIPGAALFVQELLQVPTEGMLVAWDAELAEDSPALEALLLRRYDGERVGAFSEPLFLSMYPGISQRGNRLQAALLDASVPPEPPSPRTLEPPAGLTRRQRMEWVLNEVTCVGCHQVMDPPGFSLERFDELGQVRTHELGMPVDTSGAFRVFPVGGSIEFTDIEDLGAQLADSCLVNQTFADRFLRFALDASDMMVIELEGHHSADRARMRQAFLSEGRTYRSLIKEYARGPTLRSL